MSLHGVQKRIASKLGLSTRYAGEEITLHGDEDDTITAMVELDDVVADPNGDEQAEVTGRIRVKTSVAATVRGIQIATIREQRFHINGDGIDEHGLTAFTVIRDTGENSHTNIFDLNEEQATWNDR